MRTLCQRCLRPEPFCVCRGLVPVTARTPVVILQHPREARLAICSAWLARLSLVNAELHRGVRFEDYDLPGLKTVEGVCVLGGERAAWFRDPEGNTLCIHQDG